MVFRTLLFSILAASASLTTVYADEVPLTGKWTVHTSVAGNESDQSCDFTQKDRDLTGKCVSDRGTVEIAGKVDAKKVTWFYKSEYNGSPLTVSYTGTLDANRITGSVNVEEYGVGGEFSAVPAK